MPGLVGFTSLETLSPQQLFERLKALKSNLIVPENHIEHDILFAPQTAGCLVGPEWQKSTRIYQNNTGLIAWLDGDLFNRKTLIDQRNWTFESDLELLISIVNHPERRSALKILDGLFSAVILDSYKNQLHILTDRYGLRPVYWHVDKKGLSWSSEPKAFLRLPHFSPLISADTAETFLTTGQLPPGQTWMDGVTQVPPATHLTYDTRTGALTRERYWWWDQIAPRVGKTSRADLIAEFGNLFQSAVQLRTQADQQGLMLSGGLDSRAVFAALSPGHPTFTFGQPQSDEIRIAAKVAALNGSPHTILPLSQENWLQQRIEAVWWTDGALNLMHMHGVEHLEALGDQLRSWFNGAGGDGLAGAGHLYEHHEHSHYLSQNLQIDLENNPFARQHLERAFQNARSAHAFYVDWRMRGFTIHGPRMGLFKGIDYRLPFLDNGLQEFLFGLPLSLKQNGLLYTEMLLHTFPAYFKDIPWAKTGRPITWSKWAVRSGKVLQKLRKSPRAASVTNYAAWLRENPARFVIKNLLCSPNARFGSFVSPRTFSNLWADHLSGADNSEHIGRYLTMELYLRQLYDHQYRSYEDTCPLFIT
jgi:asparagine synthase (glutamine-hydrolysing)